MKKIKDSLGNRMKEFYEFRTKTKLTRRTPCIIRLDGCHFHTFTKGFVKPFDKRLMETMQEVTLELCKSIQGCVFGYTQSDEITLILTDYENLNSSAWYDYEVQKICSVAASMATFFFNKIFRNKVETFVNEHSKVVSNPQEYGEELSKSVGDIINVYTNAVEIGAVFDARCFNVPISDVCNAILWRQKDCTRNSINSLGQAWFKHKELEGKSTNEVQDMLFNTHGINWNNLSTVEKRGTAIVKDENGKWFIDTEMPILMGENRKYVESRIIFGQLPTS